MNFYSDNIIKNIIDQEPLENIIEALETFKLQCKYVLTKYTANTIHYQYVDYILEDPRTIIVFHCLDATMFDIYNCPSILVYRRVRFGDELRYYVLLTCTKRSFRGQGYCSRLLDGFKEEVKREESKKTSHTITTKKIVLNAIEDAVLFYES